jgi:hypothetical protein
MEPTDVAFFKDKHFVEPSNSDVFKIDYRAGSGSPHAGIFCCVGCGRKIGMSVGQKLPPLDHRQRAADQGSVRWRLVVFPDVRPTAARRL